jgi:hypothetical protein
MTARSGVCFLREPRPCRARPKVPQQLSRRRCPDEPKHRNRTDGLHQNGLPGPGNGISQMALSFRQEIGAEIVETPRSSAPAYRPCERAIAPGRGNFF